MNKRRVPLMIVLLAISAVFLNSCRVSKSYGVLAYEVISECEEYEYLTSEMMEDFCINNIVVVPEIKAISHESYVVYFIAYSSIYNDSLSIRNISIVSADDTVVFSSEDNTYSIICAREEEGYFSGSIKAGLVDMNIMNAISGNSYSISLEAVAEDENGNQIQKEIYYYATVEQFISLVP